uniref:Uncharacterized protein n=1 Tax=Haemonchus contortus TaxID=6289 RepID=A0A7I4YUL5_HAECO
MNRTKTGLSKQEHRGQDGTLLMEGEAAGPVCRNYNGAKKEESLALSCRLDWCMYEIVSIFDEIRSDEYFAFLSAKLESFV